MNKAKNNLVSNSLINHIYVNELSKGINEPLAFHLHYPVMRVHKIHKFIMHLVPRCATLSLQAAGKGRVTSGGILWSCKNTNVHVCILSILFRIYQIHFLSNRNSSTKNSEDFWKHKLLQIKCFVAKVFVF